MRFYAAVPCLLALAAAVLPAQAIERLRVWHEGRQIDVVDQDGWAIYDGDIIVGRTAQVLERSRSEGPNGARIGSMEKSTTFGGQDRHWPRGAGGLFEVPYIIETDPDDRVPDAVALFNASLSGFMQAVPRTNHADYVAFTLSATDNSGACSSSIGRVGGRQVIQGSHSCGAATLVHELGHAVGLYHEQEHPDNALFVQITLANVDPQRAHNFIPSANLRGATPYDFASIMHYGSTTFTREGEQGLETIPPGIAIGQRVGFSAADIEGIRRLYGSPPQQVTVTSFPTGLTVLVDGVTTVTPATFNWSIGSSHVLDVPTAAQTMSGAAHVFARWNVDRSGDLASRRVITVTAGDGSYTAPTTHPAFSTYTATFVRHKEVRLTTSGNRTGVGGSQVATPPPSTLPGLTGTYYRERQDFSLNATPNSGAALGCWCGSYFYNTAHTTTYRPTFRGPVVFSDSLQTAYEYRAAFVDFPMLSIRARSQDGEALGLLAQVTRGTNTSSNERLPYNTYVWSGGQAGTIAASATQSPFAPTVRYVFLDWDGNPSPSISVTNPSTGQPSRTITGNFSKEYQAFKQVTPSCGGSITLPGDSTAWYAHGSSIPVSLDVNPGWTFAGWDGSLSGTATVTNLAVDDVPNLIANLNTVATRLSVTSVTPASVTSGVPVTLQITGTGFTPLSEVYVSGAREPSTFVSSTQLTATVIPADFPSTGLAIVTVANRPGTSTCVVAASGKVDVIGNTSSDTSVSYQGLWLNANEAGWGVNVTHQGTTLFATWFTYDADGTGMWLVMSSGNQTSPGNFSGTLYRTVGPAFNASPFNSISFPANYATVGTLTFSFTDANTGTMSYTVNGVSQTKSLTRFIYASGGTNCTLGGTQGASPNYQDLWLRSATGTTEAGWGVNITHQGDILFATWFTYLPGAGSTNKGMWVVMSNGNRTAPGVYTGDLQTTTGPAFNAQPFNPNAVVRSTVGSGTFTFTFADANNGTFNYTVNGVTQSKPIARFIYASPATVCR